MVLSLVENQANNQIVITLLRTMRPHLKQQLFICHYCEAWIYLMYILLHLI